MAADLTWNGTTQTNQVSVNDTNRMVGALDAYKQEPVGTGGGGSTRPTSGFVYPRKV